MAYLNQLEPDALIRSFLKHPPQGFCVQMLDEGVPAFSTQFDLLTTADDDLRQKLQKLPLYKFWRKWLSPQTCFVGSTVSEYALLPCDVEPIAMAQSLKQKLSPHYPLLIVKDIPVNSPLISAQENEFSCAFMSALQAQGFIRVQGQALAYVNVDYESIDAYFARLSAGRRKDFKRKLKKKSYIDIRILRSGDACFFNVDVLNTYYALYMNVFKQSEVHFDLLSFDFFKSLLQDVENHAVIFTYHVDGELIGYNICFVVEDMLIDKYIGLVYPQAREYNLYFVSWFYNLEYALEHGLKRYIAGWTDPQVKASLGAEFTWTEHAVFVRNPIIRKVLRALRHRFESDRLWSDKRKSSE